MKMFINVTLLPSYLWFSLLQSHAFPIQFPLITVLTPGELWDNYLFRFLPGNAHSTAHALSSTAALLFPKIVIMTDLHVSLLSSNSWPASLARFISPSVKMPWRPWHGKTPNHWTPNQPATQVKQSCQRWLDGFVSWQGQRKSGERGAAAEKALGPCTSSVKQCPCRMVFMGDWKHRDSPLLSLPWAACPSPVEWDKLTLTNSRSLMTLLGAVNKFLLTTTDQTSGSTQI